jgi:hypothetical protein
MTAHGPSRIPFTNRSDEPAFSCGEIALEICRLDRGPISGKRFAFVPRENRLPFFPDRALGVEPQEVVPGEAESTDGRL